MAIKIIDETITIIIPINFPIMLNIIVVKLFMILNTSSSPVVEFFPFL